MALTDFKGIQEMGIICGGGLIICLVPMMTLLPVLLLRGRQNVIDHQQGDLDERRARIENIWLQRPLLVTLDHPGPLRAGRHSNPQGLFRLQPAAYAERGTAGGHLEQKLIDSTPKSVLFAAVVADDLSKHSTLKPN